MDFSRFVNLIETQKQVFEGFKNKADANGYDNICNALNGALNEMTVVASVLPVSSKVELINILRTLRAFAIELVEYKVKFFGGTTKAPVESTPEPVAQTPAPEPQQPNVVSMDVGSAMGQAQGQAMANTNAKSLTLTNPSIPNGNVFAQFNQAA